MLEFPSTPWSAKSSVLSHQSAAQALLVWWPQRPSHRSQSSFHYQLSINCSSSDRLVWNLERKSTNLSWLQSKKSRMRLRLSGLLMYFVSTEKFWRSSNSSPTTFSDCLLVIYLSLFRSDWTSGRGWRHVHSEPPGTLPAPHTLIYIIRCVIFTDNTVCPIVDVKN